MKKIFQISFTLLVVAFLMNASSLSALANNPDPPRTGKISGKSVVAGALSLLIWPGIGQAVNDDKGEKVLTHVVLGIF